MKTKKKSEFAKLPAGDKVLLTICYIILGLFLVAIIFSCSICSDPGGSKPPSWSAGRSAKRNTTAGATSTRSWIKPGSGPKCPRKLCPMR